MKLGTDALKELAEKTRQARPDEVVAMARELLRVREEEDRDGTVPVWFEHPSFKTYRSRLRRSELHAGARVSVGGRIFTVGQVDQPAEPEAVPHVRFKT